MSDSRGPFILCVDDEPRALRGLARMLKEAGLEAHLAGSGDEALRRALERPPDLVLLDIRMPEMDGYEVCARLQESAKTAGIPVIFLTGLKEARDKARALAAGGADYVEKPFRPEMLLEKIYHHLEQTSHWKEIARETVKLGRIQPCDFVGFRASLLERLNVDEATRKRCSTLSPADLYPFALQLGVPGEDLAHWIADHVGFEFMQSIDADSIILGALPVQFCRTNHVVAVESDEDGPVFVVDNPFQWEVLDVLRYHVEPGQQPRLRISGPATFASLFEETGVAQMVPDALSDEVIRTRESRVKERVAAPDEEKSLDVLESDSAPAIRLANSIIAEAVRVKASDIHLEPMEKEVSLRLRVDGMLMPQNPVPKAVQGPLLSRIKIMARLDIAERRVPQDGRIRVLYAQRPVDLRVSTLPTRHGEKIVIRILDKSAISLDLDALGLEEQPMAALRESIVKPHGILLVTGPTGSGKTTTLYSALTALNRPQSNIVTVEDPIEYDLARVNQVQVHPVAGLTFPAALRAILRQDPDIIMVGEIRDGETLDIAMKAALTGHLVLSTLHTNDAVSTISRLLDMGSEPFLAASTVEMISAQRLLRRLCPHCREPATVPDEVLEGFGVPVHDQMEFFRAKGCPECSRAGYRGRLAASEVLVMDEGLRQLVSRAADRGALRRHVVDTGRMRTLRQNAFLKAARGLTSLEEVLRVTG